MVLSPAARFLPYCALLCSAAEAFVVHRSTAATTATRGGATGSQILPHTQLFVATQDESSTAANTTNTKIPDKIFDGKLWLKGAIRQKLDKGWNPDGVINGVPDKEFLPPGEPAPFPTKWEAPPGWKGGFAQSNPAFAYPQTHPDLSSIPVTTNLGNIPKVTRMMKAKWPEFSWEVRTCTCTVTMIIGDGDSDSNDDPLPVSKYMIFLLFHFGIILYSLPLPFLPFTRCSPAMTRHGYFADSRNIFPGTGTTTKDRYGPSSVLSRVQIWVGSVKRTSKLP